MSNWNIFKFEVPRFKLDVPYEESTRVQCEQAVAKNIAMLLSKYGHVVPEEVDADPSPKRAAIKTYSMLQLNKKRLEDGSILEVSQLPLTQFGVNTEPGVHSVSLYDSNDESLFDAQIYDPKLRRHPAVTDIYGDPFELEVISEIYDATLALHTFCKTSKLPIQVPPHNTTAYPKPFIEDSLLPYLK